MTDRFDEWKFPETFDESQADSLITFAHTFDKDSGDFAVFPWQFPQTFGGTVTESVTASQVGVTTSPNSGFTTRFEISANAPTEGATMNSTSLKNVEPITATPTVSTASPTAGSVSISQQATTVSTAAKPNSVGSLNELITGTLVSASGDTNNGSITKYSLLSTPVESNASLNTVDPLKDGITGNIISVESTVNSGELSNYNISGVQSVANATINNANTLSGFSVTSTPVNVSVTPNISSLSAYTIGATPITSNALTVNQDVRIDESISGTPYSVQVRANDGSISTFTLSTDSVSVSGQMNDIISKSTDIIQSSQADVIATVNNPVDTFRLNGTQVSVDSTTLSPFIDFSDVLQASQVTAVGTVFGADVLIVKKIASTQNSVTANTFIGDTSTVLPISSTSVDVVVSVNDAGIRVIQYGGFGDISKATFADSRNQSSFKANVNEVE